MSDCPVTFLSDPSAITATSTSSIAAAILRETADWLPFQALRLLPLYMDPPISWVADTCAEATGLALGREASTLSLCTCLLIMWMMHILEGKSGLLSLMMEVVQEEEVVAVA